MILFLLVEVTLRPDEIENGAKVATLCQSNLLPFASQVSNKGQRNYLGKDRESRFVSKLELFVLVF